MVPNKSNPEWLVTENVPCLDKSLERRMLYAVLSDDFSKQLIEEVDLVIRDACIAIGLHYGRQVLICPNCDKLVRPRPTDLERYFCRQCERWFKDE